MGTIRKSVQKKNKEARKKSQGLPRVRSQNEAKKRMMKEYTKFMTKRVVEERALREQISKIENLTSHEDMGLPEEVDLETLRAWKESRRGSSSDGYESDDSSSDSRGNQSDA